MTSFADPYKMEYRSRRGAMHVTTVEVGHASSRQGIIVELSLDSAAHALVLLRCASDLAADAKQFDRTSPGAWAIAIGFAALDDGWSAAVQRVPQRGGNHFALVVPRSRMLEEHPAWPTIVCPGGEEKDIRSRYVLEGTPPCDADIVALKLHNQAAATLSDEDIRELWEAGLIVFDDDALLQIVSHE